MKKAVSSERPQRPLKIAYFLSEDSVLHVEKAMKIIRERRDGGREPSMGEMMDFALTRLSPEELAVAIMAAFPAETE